MGRKRALVTGASRGIGKAIAVELARIGYDVVISARTISPGEVRDNSLTIHRSDTRPLPGSLSETAAEIRALGGEALPIAADLTDLASVGACAQRILDTWGEIDLIVHNGRHLGPGLMDMFMDIPLDAYGKFFTAHCLAPIVLTKALLPGMLARGEPRLITITSSAHLEVPPGLPGKGGWGLGYGVGKGAGHPLAMQLYAEYRDQGMLSWNVQPGYIATERNHVSIKDYGRELTGVAGPSVVGAVIAWLLTTSEGAALAGTMVEAQPVARAYNLHPAWD
ncbi:MAG TPA: SDR family oxidoreductase [Novosphingobium sp.]|nr:SDR family oxidoreductase [Novosphingobium sp.]